MVSSHNGGEARAQPVQAKNRKQVDFAEVQMGVGREEAHVWASGGAGCKKRSHFCVPRLGSPEALSWVSGCLGTRQSTDSCN